MRAAVLLLDDIGVQYAFLFQVVRDGVLGQKWRLHADFSPDPFALPVRRVGRVIARASRAELWTKRGTLDLIELPKFAPALVTDGTSNIDF
jgi:hypothetical protein